MYICGRALEGGGTHAARRGDVATTPTFVEYNSAFIVWTVWTCKTYLAVNSRSLSDAPRAASAATADTGRPRCARTPTWGRRVSIMLCTCGGVGARGVGQTQNTEIITGLLC